MAKPDPASDVHAQLRLARPDEAEAITDLALRSKRVWGYSDAFMSVVASAMELSAEAIHDDHVEVLESNRGIVGFLRLQRHRREAWLEDLFIDPDAVHRGHGRRLFERAAEVSRGWGYSVMSFESDPHAEGFYLRLGAERVGSAPSELIPGRSLPLMRFML